MIQEKEQVFQMLKSVVTNSPSFSAVSPKASLSQFLKSGFCSKGQPFSLVSTA